MRDGPIPGGLHARRRATSASDSPSASPGDAITKAFDAVRLRWRDTTRRRIARRRRALALDAVVAAQAELVARWRPEPSTA